MKNHAQGGKKVSKDLFHQNIFSQSFYVIQLTHYKWYCYIITVFTYFEIINHLSLNKPVNLVPWYWFTTLILKNFVVLVYWRSEINAIIAGAETWGVARFWFEGNIFHCIDRNSFHEIHFRPVLLCFGFKKSKKSYLSNLQQIFLRQRVR